MVGQGYHGASAMSAVFNGVQAIISNEHPAALYVHCSSHCLNLTLSAACKLSDIRNAHGIVGEVADFFSRSAKRVTLFLKCVEELVPEMKRKKLVQLCETRWVERHDAIITFVQLFARILAAIIDKCQLLDANTGAKASMLGHSIRTPQFIVAVVVLENILSVTLPSKALQSVTIDLIHALSIIKCAHNLLLQKRHEAEESFTDIWQQATKLSEEAGIELLSC